MSDSCTYTTTSTGIVCAPASTHAQETSSWWDITSYSLGFWIPVLLVVGLALLALYNTFFTVSQMHVGIVERFGKFQRLAPPGLNLKVPFIDRVADEVSLAVQFLRFEVQTKTKDAFVAIKVTIQYQIDCNRVQQAYYDLSDPEEQMKSYADNIIRSEVPNQSLEELFSQFASIAVELYRKLNGQEGPDRTDASSTDAINFHMSEYGYRILNVQIEEIKPAPEVRAAIDNVLASKRELEAARNRGEAVKAARIAEAEADARSKELQGVGMAKQRDAIVDSLVASGRKLRELGVSPEEALRIVALAQQTDATVAIAERSRAVTLMVPYSPGTASVEQQVLTGQLQAQAVQGNTGTNGKDAAHA